MQGNRRGNEIERDTLINRRTKFPRTAKNQIRPTSELNYPPPLPPLPSDVSRLSTNFPRSPDGSSFRPSLSSFGATAGIHPPPLPLRRVSINSRLLALSRGLNSHRHVFAPVHSGIPEFKFNSRRNTHAYPAISPSRCRGIAAGINRAIRGAPPSSVSLVVVRIGRPDLTRARIRDLIWKISFSIILDRALCSGRKQEPFLPRPPPPEVGNMCVTCRSVQPPSHLRQSPPPVCGPSAGHVPRVRADVEGQAGQGWGRSP